MRSAAMADLSHALGDLAHLRPARLQADLRRGRGDGRGDSAAHRLTPGRLLERLGVGVRDSAEVVVLLGEGAGCGTHPGSELGIPCQTRQVAGENLDLVVADGNLQRDLVRQLREPADVADDLRAAGFQRANADSRGLAHGRVPEADADVGRREQRPEAVLRYVVEMERVFRNLELDAGCDGADEQQQRLGDALSQQARSRRAAAARAWRD